MDVIFSEEKRGDFSCLVCIIISEKLIYDASFVIKFGIQLFWLCKKSKVAV